MMTSFAIRSVLYHRGICLDVWADLDVERETTKHDRFIRMDPFSFPLEHSNDETAGRNIDEAVIVKACRWRWRTIETEPSRVCSSVLDDCGEVEHSRPKIALTCIQGARLGKFVGKGTLSPQTRLLARSGASHTVAVFVVVIKGSR